MDRLAYLVAASLVLARSAAAQPVTLPAPDPAPAPAAEPAIVPPLAQLRDDKQLAQALATITQDPAIPVDDPSLRPLAQALMIEGVKQLQVKAYDQALANFLEAYAKFPSPKILLNIASTLRDMGRLADAANTYQRYLADPATAAHRVAEVKELLLRLDEQLTILTVRVVPRGSDVSIDGGPFVPVGSTLQTRVRPGIHLLRVRNGEASAEISLNGFEGETKEVPATVQMDVGDPVPPPNDPAVVVTTQPTPATAPPPAPVPEHVDAWLTTGTQYGSDGRGRVRKVRTGFAGPVISPIIPVYEALDDGTARVTHDDKVRITSGVIGVVRIDGQLRGAAGGIGLAVAWDRLEADVMFLRSEQTGGYLGARYRLLTGFFRPYVALGMPGFIYDQMDASGGTATKLAIGVRAAGGLELMINGHLSVQADLGYEHFFGVDDSPYEADVFVPTVGVIGRL